MDKKSKEALRRYKKSRQESESSSSSGSSDSYSSSSSGHTRKKKLTRRSSSSSDERRKREKREHCQKKLEAKRNHLKRKLKEAKLKKRAAAAAAALSGHSHRALSPSTQAKLKKLAERKHLRAASKERREREKHRSVARDRSSRSPTKITKIRIHQDVKRQKSPPRMHHQMMSREKIIIQTRTNRSPSVERDRMQRHEHKIRHHDDRRERFSERAEREAARDKERAEALARCQERQKERERIAREKLRREEEDRKYGSGERLLPRPAERELAIANARGYNSRERSLSVDSRLNKRDVYDREREFMDTERRGIHDREREFLPTRRREVSQGSEHLGQTGSRTIRDAYGEEEHERVYIRPTYMDDTRHPREPWMDIRERHDSREHIYGGEEPPRERVRTLAARGEWKTTTDWEVSPHVGQRESREWNDNVPSITTRGRGGFLVGGIKRGGPGKIMTIQHAVASREAGSEPDWDADEDESGSGKLEQSKHRTHPNFGSINWNDQDGQRDKPERRWPGPKEWREADDLSGAGPILARIGLPHRGRGRGFRRGGLEHGERGGFRSHPPTMMNLNVPPAASFHAASNPRFALNRNLTYTNPNLIRKQQAAKAAAHASAVTAVAAAKAAAQSAANAITNPSIFGQVRHQMYDDKPEAGEVIADDSENEKAVNKTGELSEISDSDDDILNKAERKNKNEDDLDKICKDGQTELGKNKSTMQDDNDDGEDKADDEEMLDFEEISDGELEEDARNKGVGDALGVDWASLIAETRKQSALNSAPNVNEQTTTAKQKWQPHRIILDIGISMQMAGEEYAKRLLSEAQKKLNEEMAQVSLHGIKHEIKNEVSEESTDKAPNEQLNADNTNVEEPSMENVTVVNVNQLSSIACIQLAERQKAQDQRMLLINACGSNSRALSARQDLQLRRQLCGLPAVECNMPKSVPLVSSKLKAMAMAAFQRTLEVK